MKNSYKNAMHKLPGQKFDKKKCLADGLLFLPLKSAADTDTDCWKKSVSAKIILHRYIPVSTLCFQICYKLPFEIDKEAC